MEKNPKKKIPNRYLWIAGVLVGGSLLVLISLPLAIEWGAEYVLTDLTDGEVRIADVDFNPFTGRLNVTALAGDERHPVLEFGLATIKVAWIPLLRREIKLVEVELVDTTIVVHRHSEGQTQVSGYRHQPVSSPEPPGEEESEPWGFVLNRLAMSNVRIEFHDGDLVVNTTVRNLELTDFGNVEPEKAAHLRAKLDLQGGKVDCDISMQPFLEQPALKGRIDIFALPLSWVQPLVQNNLEELDGVLTAGINFDLKAPAESSPLALSADGEVGFAGVELFPVDQPYRVQNESFSWQGSLRVTGETSELSGNIELGELGIEDLTHGSNVLQFASLKVNELSLKGDDGQVAGLALDGLRLLPGDLDDKDMLSVQHLKLDEPRWGKQSFQLANVEIDGLMGRLVLQSNGEIAGVDRLRPASSQIEQDELKTESEVADGKPEGQAENPFSWTVGGLSLRRGHVFFIDETLAEPYRLDLDKIILNIGKISSTAVNAATSVKLEGSFDKFATLKLGGDIRPLLEKPGVQLEGEIRNFNLPPVSPYTQKGMEMRITQGQLDSDIELTLIDNQLDADIGLLLRRFETAQSRAFEAGKEKPPGSLVNMPLNLLKDRKDEIHLNLPISGDISSPEFGVASVVNQALAKAVQNAVMGQLAPLGVTLLTGAVLPPGSTWLASTLFDMLTHVDFPAVTFAPLQTDLPSDSEKQMKKTVALLKERPKLRLRLCGVAAVNDLSTLQQQQLETWDSEQQSRRKKGEALPAVPDYLLELEPGVEHFKTDLLTLAQQRSEAVKLLLVSEHQVEANRLFLCDPDIDILSAEPPRVEVAL